MITQEDAILLISDMEKYKSGILFDPGDTFYLQNKAINDCISVVMCHYYKSIKTEQKDE